MARPEARQVAGYFPTPSRLLSSIASTLVWQQPEVSPVLVDPCAGSGEAIATLRSIWAESYTSGKRRPSWMPSIRPRVLACELEAERAALLEAKLSEPGDAVFHADAFQLAPSHHEVSRVSVGITVLWLNPPYDHDPQSGRLEERFLARFAPQMAVGGVLLFLVPFVALTASAETLATRFTDLRCWRLPEPEWHDFHQVLVQGRAVPVPISAEFYRKKVLRWAEHPEELPVLPETCPEPLEVADVPRSTVDFHYELREPDFAQVLAVYRVFGEREELARPLAELVASRFETAMPPKPAHIALALAAGLFNARLLYPNDRKRHPALLVKGTCRRRRLQISERKDSDGEVVGVVEREIPELHLTVLLPDTGEILTLKPGAEPSGSRDLEDWTAADLITHYHRALAESLAKQFPALHDPVSPRARLELPALARKPFRVQDQAVQGLLKLIARGRSPYLVGEVGTGKSTMALFVAAALSPAHHADITGQLAEQGFTRPLPVVRRTLVLAPPHLMKSWTDQALAVMPQARVVVAKKPSDLGVDAEVTILSREAAKLGPGVVGVAKRCPGCGRLPVHPPEKLAEHRARCPGKRREPANLAARLLLDLAVPLALSAPESRASLYVRGFAAGQCNPENPRELSRQWINGPLGRMYRAVKSARGRLEAEEWKALHSWMEGTTSAYLELSLDKMPHLLTVLTERFQQLEQLASWKITECREMLWYFGAKPRRWPLAKHIVRYHRDKYSLVILDEAHEANHGESAQSKAAHRLARLPGAVTLALTGSLMGGYASHLFANLHAMSEPFREEFDREAQEAFVDVYGFRKIYRETSKSEGQRRRGSSSDRDLDGVKVIGESPGVLPSFITRHLLPQTVFVHKADLDVELPAMRELPVPITFEESNALDQTLLSEYRRLRGKLLSQIRGDKMVKGLSGRLFGALGQLPSYLDRATDDLPPFELAYPKAAGGKVVAAAEMLPETYHTPKERWLLDTLRQCREDGEKVLLFLSHTGTAELPGRIRRLVEEVAPGAVFLSTQKVPAADREAWIDRHVIEKNVPVLVVNPNGVKTGLNNLVSFTVAIWYELDSSALTYRQANGRLHRIGQTRPVTVYVPFYRNTTQQIAFDLLAQKVSASLKVDGLDLAAALESAGAGDETSSALSSVMGLGQAIYARLTSSS